MVSSALTLQQIRQYYNQISNDPDVDPPEPDEWERLIERAREDNLTQEDIELALAIKRAGLTRADIAVVAALKEKLGGRA